MVGWEVHKFIVVKSFIVLSSWIFGYFGMKQDVYKRQYHHKEGVEGLNPGGGHFPPQDDAVGLLGGEKRERGACLLVGLSLIHI